jgi:hypothetical protein
MNGRGNEGYVLMQERVRRHPEDRTQNNYASVINAHLDLLPSLLVGSIERDCVCRDVCPDIHPYTALGPRPKMPNESLRLRPTPQVSYLLLLPPLCWYRSRFSRIRRRLVSRRRRTRLRRRTPASTASVVFMLFFISGCSGCAGRSGVLRCLFWVAHIAWICWNIAPRITLVASFDIPEI